MESLTKKLFNLTGGIIKIIHNFLRIYEINLIEKNKEVCVKYNGNYPRIIVGHKKMDCRQRQPFSQPRLRVRVLVAYARKCVLCECVWCI